jgi:phosphate transport system permease protein
MLTIPQFESALMFASLILMVIVLLFNVVSRFILVKIEENIK